MKQSRYQSLALSALYHREMDVQVMAIRFVHCQTMGSSSAAEVVHRRAQLQHSVGILAALSFVVIGRLV